MNKIFQIGFNKCGTYSLYELFKYQVSNKCLKSIHWDYGKLSLAIFDNLSKNKFLLSGYDHIDVFTDMEVGIQTNDKIEYKYAYKLYKQFDEDYPESRFILNTRDIDNWINSRLKHESGWVIHNSKIKKLDPKPLYYETQLNFYNCSSKEELIDLWKDEWNKHHQDVLEYFSDRPDDLLVFDIEKDSLDKIKEFFKKDHIEFSAKIFPHLNKTKVQA